jgi:hypothetical protein
MKYIFITLFFIFSSNSYSKTAPKIDWIGQKTGILNSSYELATTYSVVNFDETGRYKLIYDCIKFKNERGGKRLSIDLLLPFKMSNNVKGVTIKYTSDFDSTYTYERNISDSTIRIDNYYFYNNIINSNNITMSLDFNGDGNNIKNIKFNLLDFNTAIKKVNNYCSIKI